MKAWLTSLNGAVTLSVLALLAALAWTMWWDAPFVLRDVMWLREDQPMTIVLFMLLETVFVGGWIWALLAAERGGRGGVIWSFIFSLFAAVASGYTLVWCSSQGCAAWEIGNAIVWAGLIVGLAASVTLGFQLKHARQPG
jgi:hypothetical protein